jgi:hypothetical protein
MLGPVFRHNVELGPLDLEAFTRRALALLLHAQLLMNHL